MSAYYTTATSTTKVDDNGKVIWTYDFESIEELLEKLAALQQERDALKAAKTECEKLLKEAAELCDDSNSEEWIWKWKVAHYFEETDIPVHPLPEDMK